MQHEGRHFETLPFLDKYLRPELAHPDIDVSSAGGDLLKEMQLESAYFEKHPDERFSDRFREPYDDFARLLTEDPSFEFLGSNDRCWNGILICCHHCGRFFYRNAKHQQYCDRPECQKARNAKNQRDFRKRKSIEKAREKANKNK